MTGNIHLLDALICSAVIAGVVGYLGVQPHHLGVADESRFLVGAKRILAGEVLYRDVFCQTTPGFYWVMALVFALAGTTMSAARVTMTVVHLVAALMLYFTCRQLGVRRSLSVTVPAAYIALCQPAWPFASPHWASTLVMALLLLTMVRLPWRSRPRWLFVPGLLTGMLVAVEQQKGAVFALGLCGLLAVDGWLRRGYHAGVTPLRIRSALTWFALGSLAVVIPVSSLLVATAGFWPLADQLVLHPLFGYRVVNRTTWGDVSFLTLKHAAYTSPLLLKWLPLVIPIGIARATLKWRARGDENGFGNLVVLIAVASLSAFSILYNPDFIHIASVAPVFFVFWAETVEAGVQRIGAIVGLEWFWSTALACGLLAVLAVHLSSNMARDRRSYPITSDTPFGRLAFENPEEIRLIERVGTLLRAIPSRLLFAYPTYAALYLTAEAQNPTRFELLLPGYNSVDHVEEVLAVLETKRVPYVVLVPALLRQDDPVAAYVSAHYEAVENGKFNLLGHPEILRRAADGQR